MGQINPTKYSPSPNSSLSPELQKLLSCSFVVIDKPRGPSSHEVAAWVRKILGVNKSGHSGTLDPNVSGVLPVGIGKATRLLPYLTTRDKKYVCLMRTGKEMKEEELARVYSKFVGEITQMPPRQAAVARRLRKRKVYYIKPLQTRAKQALFEVHCEAGTYVRVLVSDFGRFCGGAEMLELRRISVGSIPESQATKLQDLSDAIWAARSGYSKSAVSRMLAAPQDALALPEVVLRNSAVEAVCAGSRLYSPGLASSGQGIACGEPVSMLSEKSEFLGVGRALVALDDAGLAKRGALIAPECIIMERGKYPKNWKSR